MKYTKYYSSPIGEILLSADDEGLTGLWFEGEKYFAHGIDNNHAPKELQVFDDTFSWLDLYFDGIEPDFTPPIHMIGTSFRKEVWDILLQIPYGKTITYGEKAKMDGFYIPKK